MFCLHINFCQYYQTRTLRQSVLHPIWPALYEDLSAYSCLKQSQNKDEFWKVGQNNEIQYH